MESLCGIFAHAFNRYKRKQNLAVIHAELRRKRLAEPCRSELIASGVHFIGNLIDRIIILLLRRRIRSLRVDFLHLCQNRILSFQNRFSVKVRNLRCEIGRVKLLRIVNLVPCHTETHHRVGNRMGAREHVFNLVAGIDVPVGNIVLLHRRNLLIVEVFLSLTDDFHDFERGFILNALQNQIVHDVVSG